MVERGGYNLILVRDGVQKENLVVLVKQNDLEKHVWFYGVSYG